MSCNNQSAQSAGIVAEIHTKDCMAHRRDDAPTWMFGECFGAFERGSGDETFLARKLDERALRPRADMADDLGGSQASEPPAVGK